MTYTISLAPLFDILIPIVGILLTVAASYSITLLSKKFKIDIEAKHREALQGALQNAIGFCLKKAADAGKNFAQIETKNELLANGVNYVLASTPDALNKLGINETRLRELLEARLGWQETVVK